MGGRGGFKIDGPAGAPATIRVIYHFGVLNEMPGLSRADSSVASRNDFDNAGHVVVPFVPQFAAILAFPDFVQAAVPVVVGENDFFVREILNQAGGSLNDGYGFGPGHFDSPAHVVPEARLVAMCYPWT